MLWFDNLVDENLLLSESQLHSPKQPGSTYHEPEYIDAVVAQVSLG